MRLTHVECLEVAMRNISCPAWFDLAPYVKGREILDLSIGFDGAICVLLADAPTAYREDNGIFARVRPKRPQSYIIVAIDDDVLLRTVEIPAQDMNFHFAQPMPDGNLLLVCARSHFRATRDFDRNGRVVSPDGKTISEFLLGDGIQDVQVDAGGTIWTSYFDEGIFGNFGWETPVGAAGLVAWDNAGNKSFEFEPVGILDAICDCYALNVDFADSVWCCYYTEFPLVRLRNRAIDAIWHPPISGSDAFAVAGEFALFRGGYDNPDEYTLIRLLDSGKTKTIRKYTLTDEQGVAIQTDGATARGDMIVGCFRNRIFRIRIEDFLSVDLG